MESLDHSSKNNAESTERAFSLAASELLPISKNTNLQVQDNLADKLSREANVILGGALQGLGQTTLERLSQKPGETLIQTGASGALGWGFVKLASSKYMPARYGAAVTGAALSYSFIANLACDLKDKSSSLSDVWQKTWAGAANLDHERQRIADSLGPFIFDTSLSMLAGLAGGKIAAKGIENRATLKYMQDNHGKLIDEAVFKLISQPDKNGFGYMGTSFAIGKERMATAFHVVQDKPGLAWNFESKVGLKGDATVIAGMPQRDLALLKTNGAPFETVLPLAKNLDSLPSRGVLVGAPSGNKLEARPVVLEKAGGITGNTYKSDLGMEHNGGLIQAINSGRGWLGMSGGPSIAHNGEVVGVLSAVNPVFNLFGKGTTSVPSPSLRYFEALVNKAQQPGATLSLQEAAVKLNMSPQKVVQNVNKGKLHGFLVPAKENSAQWQWRILQPEIAAGIFGK